MMTLRRFTDRPPDVPMSAAWYLADLGEAKGRQELFTRQSPQRLKALREHSMIESAVSSNRIEGVEIDATRVHTVVLGRPALRDRNEEEVRGYRNALKLIHDSASSLAVSEKTILDLHSLSRGGVGDAGQYKKRDIDIIETYPDGRSRVRFKTVPAERTSAAMSELISGWNDALEDRRLHPLLAVAAFNLDFLCIHPFRDGNGRVSRLLLLLQCYHLGFEVGRYISIERIIEQNKDRYYETLEQSSQGWHEGKHDPWPYLGYLLFILKEAYRELEDRLGQVKAPRGEKSEVVIDAIRQASDDFSIADLQRECPGVSVDMIRHILKRLRQEDEVECLGRGQNARWRRSQPRIG
ncbi:MAG TPA: Fic family protein [Thermoanaerobaculia bacterium]|nr:Fic family protein [Thermoanaerobaculia bacterium]